MTERTFLPLEDQDSSKSRATELRVRWLLVIGAVGLALMAAGVLLAVRVWDGKTFGSMH